MKQIKTSELQGKALDYCVAVCEGHKFGIYAGGRIAKIYEGPPNWFEPSSNWSQGGPIIEREKIDVEYRKQSFGDGDPHWYAIHPKNAGGLIRYSGRGSNALQAVMRCYVASKMGEMVLIPDELV